LNEVSYNSGIAEERFRLILAHLRQNEVVSVADLCGRLDVSAATVRRDLGELDSRGLVRRVRGGAMSLQSRLGEPVFEDKARVATAEKNRIARTALTMIQPTDSIFLDGGSTVLVLAGLLRGMGKLTVATNSLRVAATFSAEGPRTILVGGEFRRISQTFVGSMTRPIIEQLYVDKAFMGSIGLKDGVMTTTDPGEALTKELMISRAREVIVLADSTKLEEVSFVKFGELKRGNVLVTDDGIRDELRESLSKRGVRVLV
jgi:DeoR family fructose operon transcriptional repressor